MSDGDPDNLSFEEAMRELESIVRDLETGKAKLDDAVRAYERGAALKAQIHGTCSGPFQGPAASFAPIEARCELKVYLIARRKRGIFHTLRLCALLPSAQNGVSSTARARRIRGAAHQKIPRALQPAVAPDNAPLPGQAASRSSRHSPRRRGPLGRVSA
jgi:exodeoxyribonuclease VII small subunit